MSSSALFTNSTSRSTPKNLVEFKAGKMTMKGKMVYPDVRKGQLYVYQSDDSLMHFCWKDRVSGYVEDDLIIFPDDCEFKHVPQCKTGRVYLLRFKSSNKKFFVWLQDLKTDKDEEHCRKINEVLNNPPTPGSQRSGSTNTEGDLQNILNNMSQQQLMQLFGGVSQIGLGSLLGTMNRPQGVQSTRTSTTNASTRVTTNASTSTTQATPSPVAASDSPKPNGDNKAAVKTTDSSASGTTQSSNNKIHFSDLQNFLLEIPAAAGSDSTVQRGVATELTNAIPAAITATENVEHAMRPHLPSGDHLYTTLVSPQFSQALSLFWSALQSGQAGPVVRQFGLGQDAVNAAATGNIEEFVTALETEAKNGQGGKDQDADGDGDEDDDDDDDGVEESKKEKTTGKPTLPPTFSLEKKDDDDEGMALD